MTKRAQSGRRFLLETSQAIFEGGRARQVVMEAHDGFAVLRLKGLATAYAIPWNAVYHLAAAKEAERELRARKAEIGL